MQIMTADGVITVPWWESWKYMTIGALWAFLQYGFVPFAALIGDTLVRYQGGWKAVDWEQTIGVFVISGASGAYLYVKAHFNLLKVPPGLVLPDNWSVAPPPGSRQVKEAVKVTAPSGASTETIHTETVIAQPEDPAK